jgi:hypothetical protein
MVIVLQGPRCSKSAKVKEWIAGEGVKGPHSAS